LVAILDVAQNTGDYSGCNLSLANGAALRGQISNTTGNMLADQGFRYELIYLSQFFGVQPAFYIWNDGGSPNAKATPQVLNPAHPDGTVLFGYSLMMSELRFTGQQTNFSIPAIMAHEFMHIVQFKRGISLPTKLAELQADYMAGWFMGNRETFSVWSAQSFLGGAQTFFNKGDYAFNNAGHHGTPQERAGAIVAGFNKANVGFEQALEDSQTYLLSSVRDK